MSIAIRTSEAPRHASRHSHPTPSETAAIPGFRSSSGLLRDPPAQPPLPLAQSRPRAGLKTPQLYVPGTNESQLEPCHPPSREDWLCYLRRYPDLRQLFEPDENNTVVSACSHWADYGRHERRNPYCTDQRDCIDAREAIPDCAGEGTGTGNDACAKGQAAAQTALQGPLRRRRIVIFTMVKDEADVLESWLHYHASIAGYENLHVIDNLSTDGTEKILGRMVAQYGVHVKIASNYREKGVLITNWMKEVVQEYRLHADDVLLPIDIDEFMVRFVRRCEEEHFGRVAGTVLVGDAVRSYIGHLLAVNDSAVFKTNYLINIVGPEFNSGADPITAARSAVYATGGSKGFLTVSALAVVSKCHRMGCYHGNIDHGNHMVGRYGLQNLDTELCLVHFHERSREQVIRKVINNWYGLGYNDSDAFQPGPKVRQGRHYADAMKAILSNTTHPWFDAKAGSGPISVKPLARYIQRLQTSEMRRPSEHPVPLHSKLDVV